jgi:hypothetical protein
MYIACINANKQPDERQRFLLPRIFSLIKLNATITFSQSKFLFAAYFELTKRARRTLRLH